MTDSLILPKSIHIKGRNAPNSWAEEMHQVMSQDHIIVSGEDYKGNAKFTKDANILMELDKAAIKQITSGVLHPAFESKAKSVSCYDEEFTYNFVFNNWTLDPKYQFVYNYMDRMINYPRLASDFLYQGRSISELPMIPDKYLVSYNPWFYNRSLYKETYNRDIQTGGFDQLSWLHDAIREGGISRRHQMIIWLPEIDCFNTSPPCLQRIWLRVLVPKSEWHKYPGCIPVEAHIEYRSWDLARAQPSNLYGLLRMLYRYVLGNLTADTEYIRDADGVPISINDEGNVIDFELVRVVCFGDATHIYEDSYDMASKMVRLDRCAYED
jgi:thymidylate synthase